MDGFIQFITDPGVMEFIGTHGLATLLVLWFILWHDRRLWNALSKRYIDLNERYKDLYKEYNNYQIIRDRYRQLTDNYQVLQEKYIELSECIRPETIRISMQQTKKLNDTAIDRDLFKLYYRLCEKIADKKQEDIGSFIQETILDTNETWEEFRPPFRNPQIRSLSDLYDIYKNGGVQLKNEIEKIFHSNVDPEEKKGISSKSFVTAQ